MITSQEYDLLLDVKSSSTDEADNRSETISAPFQKQSTGLSTSSDKTTKKEVEGEDAIKNCKSLYMAMKTVGGPRTEVKKSLYHRFVALRPR